jgi:galactosylgalactosylxylosylprotein 3-beta-glucuronosyltransferase 3
VDPETGKVSKILGWTEEFKYPIDMAGFSVHTSNIRGARFHRQWPKGSLESNFLEQVVDKVEDLEPLANNCTSIYAWHVKTLMGKKEKSPRSDDPDYERIAMSV